VTVSFAWPSYCVVSQSIFIFGMDTGEPFEYAGIGEGEGATVGAGDGVAVGVGVAAWVAVGAVAEGEGEAVGAGEVQPDSARAAINNDAITT